MEPIRDIVTHISNGTEEDLKIFDSMVNSSQIDLNSQEARRSMFTTPREGFVNKTQTLGIVALILVILLLAFHKK